MPTATVIARRERLAWREYNQTMKGIETSHPQYRRLENRAWLKLQVKLANAKH